MWGRSKAYTGFCWGKLRERDHLGNPSVDGRIILRCIFRKWDVGVKLAQDRDRWQGIVNGVMNLQGPYNVGNFLTS